MGRQLPLLWAMALGLLFQGTSISGNEDFEKEFITLKPRGGSITLLCEGGNEETVWSKDQRQLDHKGRKLALGAARDDLRGLYECSPSGGKNRSLQVFFRLCQNCIRLDLATIAGISVASLLATVFLAVAVGHMATEEPGWQSQASDRQNLLANDQLYQPLQEHPNGQYSHTGVAKPRRR